MTQKTSNYKRFRHIIVGGIKLVLLITILWFVGKSLYKSIANVDWSTIVFQPVQLLIGFLIIMAAFFAGTFGLQYIYRHLDETDLSWAQAFILLSVPPLGKYLPSKIFALAGHTVLAKTFGIRMVVSSSVTLLIMGLGLSSATLIGMILLLFKAPIGSSQILFQVGVAGMVAVVIVLLLLPDIYWRMMNLALHFLNQPTITVIIKPKTMVVLFLAILFQNGLYLCGVSVMVSGMVILPVSTLPAVVGAACLANVVGFLAIFAPAGIGVREGILLVMLTPAVGPGVAGLIAVMMRIVQTGSDCIVGLAGFVTVHLLQKKTFKMH